jgi:hypothetical protein
LEQKGLKHADFWRTGQWRPPNPPLSGILQARSTIIYRTVRCATGLSGEPAEQRLTGANSRLQKCSAVNSASTEVKAQMSEGFHILFKRSHQVKQVRAQMSEGFHILLPHLCSSDQTTSGDHQGTSDHAFGT